MTAAFLDESKALACIHCGLCLGSCPTYLQTGNENESPRGRIYIMRALQAGRIPLDNASVRHIDLCLGCRACEAACPSGVQYGALLEQTRAHIETGHVRTPLQTLLRRILIERIFPHPARMKAALVPARLARAMRLDRVLPAKLREPLSLLPENIEADTIPEYSPSPKQPAKGVAGFIRGCVMSVMFGATNRATVKLLNQADYDVWAPKEQVCCGALFAHGGQLNSAREFAQKNLHAFGATAEPRTGGSIRNWQELDVIVINAAGCGSALKEYGHLLGGPSAAEFSSKVRDLTEFLIAERFAERIPPGNWSGTVTYHDACHLAHAQRITKQPRELVRAVAGSSYMELPEADVCCGSAGTYNLTQPAMAESLQERKIRNILATGAETVVTSNPGCILQIRAGLEKAAGRTIRVLHIADFLVEAQQRKF